MTWLILRSAAPGKRSISVAIEAKYISYRNEARTSLQKSEPEQRSQGIAQSYWLFFEPTTNIAIDARRKRARRCPLAFCSRCQFHDFTASSVETTIAPVAIKIGITQHSALIPNGLTTAMTALSVKFFDGLDLAISAHLAS
jgi:hypothetical protein